MNMNKPHLYLSFAPYRTDTTDGTVIYESWAPGDGAVMIRRTTIAGSSITREITSATWATRAAATYQALYSEEII